MCLERGAFKTEWGASPRAQGTVKLLWEISQIRAVVISLHAPETDVRARVENGGFLPPRLPVPAPWPRCNSAASFIIYTGKEKYKTRFQKPAITGFHYLGNEFCDFAY